MITFFECLQKFYKIPGTFRFSKKQLKAISFRCKIIYDRKIDNPPITYTTNIEEGITFNVRYYPDSFRRIIDGVLWSRHRLHTEKILPKMFAEEVIKNERKKRVIKKPVYSVKPVNK